MAICRTFNSIIRGWTNYFRYSAATKTFAALDHWMFQRQKRWVRSKHQRKGWRWKRNHYWGMYHHRRKDKWVFGLSRATYMRKFCWTPMERHVMVKGRSSPDDPTLTNYWEKRRMAKASQIALWDVRALVLRQRGKCPICEQSIREEDADCGIFAIEETHNHHVKPKSKVALRTQLSTG